MELHKLCSMCITFSREIVTGLMTLKAKPTRWRIGDDFAYDTCTNTHDNVLRTCVEGINRSNTFMTY